MLGAAQQRNSDDNGADHYDESHGCRPDLDGPLRPHPAAVDIGRGQLLRLGWLAGGSTFHFDCQVGSKSPPKELGGTWRASPLGTAETWSRDPPAKGCVIGGSRGICVPHWAQKGVPLRRLPQ